jgi:hypothetical protein
MKGLAYTQVNEQTLVITLQTAATQATNTDTAWSNMLELPSPEVAASPLVGHFCAVHTLYTICKPTRNQSNEKSTWDMEHITIL